MNEFVFSGNLTKDPWVSETGRLLSMQIAVSRGYSYEKEKAEKALGHPTVDYFKIYVQGEKRIKWLQNALKKGDGVICSGRVQSSKPDRRAVDGTPTVYIEQEFIAEKIEITNRRSARKGDCGIAPDPEETEDDPIAVAVSADGNGKEGDISSTDIPSAFSDVDNPAEW